ncbi:hypothetical protein [Pedobacter sp. Hv1]|uniref:hypothetical protein n=1 Tax=Pedobacter sp. Hv1 TaxID=1740090 RepID=UPI000A3F12CB|nr:hypothetical protein [Pedobacter sp. Hv1]
MRLLFRSLVLLDLISLVLMSMQLWYISNHYSELPNQLSVKIESILLFPMFVLVLIGAIGQFLLKKFGFILYYVQFPFRLYLYVFSIGFITMLPEVMEIYNFKWYDALLKICFMVEFIRLYLTIKGQLKMKQQFIEA